MKADMGYRFGMGSVFYKGLSLYVGGGNGIMVVKKIA